MKSKIVTISLAIAFILAIALVYVSMEQTKQALELYDNLLENYSELRNDQSYALDEANEAGFEAGFNTGYLESVDNWMNSIQEVIIDEDGNTIHLVDNYGEEWIIYADGGRG